MLISGKTRTITLAGASLASAFLVLTPASATESTGRAATEAKKEAKAVDIIKVPATKPALAVRPSVAVAAKRPRASTECQGIWCGRQFVLMLGIGY